VWYAANVADAPSPLALLLGAAFAAASGFALANLWIRHRRALARDRAHWSALAKRRGWHLHERGGTFAVLGSAGDLGFHLSQGALAHSEIGVFVEARLPHSAWLVLELFAATSPLAPTARRPGEPIGLGDARSDSGLQLWATRRGLALELCNAEVRAAFAALPRPYLLYQNGIVALIWPCVALPSDAQLDRAIACLAALAQAARASR
jgi:hypothetical protein